MTQFTKHDALNALNTYGANFDQWPDAALARFVQDNPAFQAHIIHAQALDDKLNGQAPALAPAPGLAEQILAKASMTPQTEAGGIKEASPLNAAPINAVHLPAHRPNRFKALITALFPIRNFAQIAAAGVICVISLSSVWAYQEHIQTSNARNLEAETEDLRRAANELGMADVFLWAELDQVQ